MQIFYCTGCGDKMIRRQYKKYCSHVCYVKNCERNKRFEQKCIRCGKIKLRRRSEIDKTQFCSSRCSLLGKPAWNKGASKMVTFNCNQCGKETAIEARLRKSKRMFCSQICYLEYNKENIRKMGLNNKKYSDEEAHIRSLAQGRASYRKHIDTRLFYYRRLAQIRRGIKSSLTKQEWENIKDGQDFTCNMCGKKEPEIKLTIDHIIPISKWMEWRIKNPVNYECGDKENIQGLCKSCNSSKCNKMGLIYSIRPKKLA